VTVKIYQISKGFCLLHHIKKINHGFQKKKKKH